MKRARSWAGWIGTPAILGTYLLMTTGLISMRTFFCLSLVNSALMWFHTWPVQTRPMLLMSAAFYAMNFVGLARTFR